MFYVTMCNSLLQLVFQMSLTPIRNMTTAALTLACHQGPWTPLGVKHSDTHFLFRVRHRLMQQMYNGPTGLAGDPLTTCDDVNTA